MLGNVGKGNIDMQLLFAIEAVSYRLLGAMRAQGPHWK